MGLLKFSPNLGLRVDWHIYGLQPNRISYMIDPAIAQHLENQVSYWIKSLSR
jgi:hypothetical protein